MTPVRPRACSRCFAAIASAAVAAVLVSGLVAVAQRIAAGRATDGIHEVFALVRDMLADDGVLWLNLGDSYANDSKWGGSTSGKEVHGEAAHLEGVDAAGCTTITVLEVASAPGAPGAPVAPGVPGLPGGRAP